MGTDYSRISEEIQKYPIRRIKSKRGDCIVRYDAETRTGYLLDENGNWTGKKAVLTEAEKAPAIDPAPEVPSAVPLEPEQEAESQDTPESSEPPEGRPWRPSPPLLVILAALLLIAGIWIYSAVLRSHSKPNGETTADTAVTETAATAEEPTATQEAPTPPTIEEATVTVLCAPDHILPGQALDEMDWIEQEISETDYRALLSSSSLLTAEDSLRDLVAVNFIPAGSYLSTAAVGTSYDIYNPWENEIPDGVVIPISVKPEELESVLWGCSIDLVVTITEKVQAPDSEQPSEQTQEEFPEGMVHSGSEIESIAVNTYKIQNVVILDLLDEDRNSLFPWYYIASQIPDEYRKTCLEGNWTDTADEMPAFLVVRVSQDQADFLERERKSISEIETIGTGAALETPLQRDTYFEMQRVGEIVSELMKE